MKITIVIDTMICGGAHRVSCIQANELSSLGYDVTLLLMTNAENFPYELDTNVKTQTLFKYENLEFSSYWSKIKRKLIAIPSLIKYLNRNRPELVISHIQGVNLVSILSCRLLNIPIFACEHTNYGLPYGIRGKFAYMERRFIYPLANKIILLTKKDFLGFYKSFLTNVEIIPNPSSFKAELKKSMMVRNKAILAVGDINRINIKGWDKLLLIFSQISKELPDWELKFIGNGDNGINLLKNLAKSYGVEERVIFLGRRDDIKELLQDNAIFVLSSRNEGLPMALIEAMSQGCACIAFDCQTGPSDIISDSFDGILVEDQNVKQMSEQLKKLMLNEKTRIKLSNNAVEKAKKFESKQIYLIWDVMIKNHFNNKK